MSLSFSWMASSVSESTEVYLTDYQIAEGFSNPDRVAPTKVEWLQSQLQSQLRRVQRHTSVRSYDLIQALSRGDTRMALHSDEVAQEYSRGFDKPSKTTPFMPGRRLS